MGDALVDSPLDYLIQIIFVGVKIKMAMGINEQHFMPIQQSFVRP